MFCFVFCVSVKVKLTVPLLCVCVHSAWKGRPQNDLYCVGWNVKPYSLTERQTDWSQEITLTRTLTLVERKCGDWVVEVYRKEP